MSKTCIVNSEAAHIPALVILALNGYLLLCSDDCTISHSKIVANVLQQKTHEMGGFWSGYWQIKLCAHP